MLYLRGKQIALTILIGIISLSCVTAQEGLGNQNYFGFKAKRFYFGLTLAYQNTTYRLQHSDQFIKNDSIAIAEALSGNGFAVSAIINMKIGEYFDFRVLPGASFSSRKFEFTKTTDEVQVDQLESVFVTVPLTVRYKSRAYKDTKAFVVGGVKYSYDLQSNARLRRDKFNDIMRISPHDFTLEFGFGMQFFFPYFIFSPEIKYSHGLDNILIYDDNIIRNRVIDKVYSRTFTLSLHFEG